MANLSEAIILLNFILLTVILIYCFYNISDFKNNTNKRANKLFYINLIPTKG